LFPFIFFAESRSFSPKSAPKFLQRNMDVGLRGNPGNESA